MLRTRSRSFHSDYDQRETDLFYLATHPTAQLVRAVGVGGFALFTDLGLLTLPTVAYLVCGSLTTRTDRGRLLAGWGIATLVAMGVVLAFGKLFPVTGDWLTEHGLGVLMLVGEEQLPSMSMRLRLGLTTVAAVSAIGALGLIVPFVLARVRQVHEGGLATLSASERIQLALLGVVALKASAHLPLWVYDRYLLGILSCLLAAMIGLAAVRRPGRVAIALATCLIVGQGAVAVTGTHDFFSWNLARVAALRDLQARGVSAEDFDAGREVNGVLSYDPSLPLGRRDFFWERPNARYLIAYGPQEGYRLVARYPFATWLMPGPLALVLLERE